MPYTLADRERTIRIETRMETIKAKMGALESKMDVKFEALESKMEKASIICLQNLDHLIWMSVGIVAMLLFMIGYMIWVRKSIIQSAMDKATGVGQLMTG